MIAKQIKKKKKNSKHAATTLHNKSGEIYDSRKQINYHNVQFFIACHASVLLHGNMAYHAQFGFYRLLCFSVCIYNDNWKLTHNTTGVKRKTHLLIAFS